MWFNVHMLCLDFGTSAKHNINVLYEAFELAMVWLFEKQGNDSWLSPYKGWFVVQHFGTRTLEPISLFLWRFSPYSSHNLKYQEKNFDLLEYFRPAHHMSQRPKISEEISKNHPSKSLQLPSSHLLQWLAILKAQTILASTSRSPFCSWTLSYRGVIKLSMYASLKPWWNDVSTWTPFVCFPNTPFSRLPSQGHPLQEPFI